MRSTKPTILVYAPDRGRIDRHVRELRSRGYRVIVETPSSARPGTDLPAFVDLVLCFREDGNESAPPDYLRAIPAAGPDVLMVSGDGGLIQPIPKPSADSAPDRPLRDRLLFDTIAASVARFRDHRRYHELVDEVPIGIFEIERHRIVSINEYILQRLGYDRAELLGRCPLDLIAPDDRSAAADAIDRRMAGEEPDTPNTYRLLRKSGDELVGEIRTRLVPTADGLRIEGTVRDITTESQLRRLQQVVLDLGEVILGEQDIDRILQIVLDTIAQYSGFRRAVLTLYDLSIPVPFEGDAIKVLTAGLSLEERNAVLAMEPMPVEERRMALDERFRLGPAYYIPYDQVPWGDERGISGTVTIDGWNKDDFLFIPLRGTAGVIGTISVDDPADRSAPTLETIEPVAALATFAALAVERAFKLRQAKKQNERLHGLSDFGRELSDIASVGALCDLAAVRLCGDMDYAFCSIWLVEGTHLALHGVASMPVFSGTEIPTKGLRGPIHGEGLIRHSVRFSEPIIVPDVSKERRFQGSRKTMQSAIVVPFSGRKGTLGAIEVESPRLAAFGEQDVEVLSAMGSQLAITISALRRREALARIYAFGQRVAAAETVDRIVVSTIDFLVEQFDYQLSAIFLKNADNRMEIAGIRGPYEDGGVQPGWVLPDDRGIVNWVARNRRSAVVPDVHRDPRYHQAFDGTQSELVVPILFTDRLLGVLNIESAQPGFFDEEDRQLLEVIANHLAISLANLDSQASLREQAIRDSLTGLYNRHYFNSIIAPELGRSDRYAHPFTIMMIDVDGFRAVNNKFGHLKGDEVLQNVARMLLENVRTADRVIRYGGDEFLVFMPETVGEEADVVAERLRTRISGLPRRLGLKDLEIGFSIGIYTRNPAETRSLEVVLEEVDRRMYADKRSRNADRADDYRR